MTFAIILILQMKMKMTVDGLNGVRLESVPFREEVAKEPGIEIMIRRKDLTEDYHVLDPIQMQKTAKNRNVVGTFTNVKY